MSSPRDETTWTTTFPTAKGEARVTFTVVDPGDGIDEITVDLNGVVGVVGAYDAEIATLKLRIAELEAVLYAVAAGDDVKDRIRSLLRR